MQYLSIAITNIYIHLYKEKFLDDVRKKNHIDATIAFETAESLSRMLKNINSPEKYLEILSRFNSFGVSGETCRKISAILRNYSHPLSNEEITDCIFQVLHHTKINIPLHHYSCEMVVPRIQHCVDQFASNILEKKRHLLIANEFQMRCVEHALSDIVSKNTRFEELFSSEKNIGYDLNILVDTILASLTPFLVGQLANKLLSLIERADSFIKYVPKKNKSFNHILRTYALEYACLNPDGLDLFFEDPLGDLFSRGKEKIIENGRACDVRGCSNMGITDHMPMCSKHIRLVGLLLNPHKDTGITVIHEYGMLEKDKRRPRMLSEHNDMTTNERYAMKRFINALLFDDTSIKPHYDVFLDAMSNLSLTDDRENFIKNNPHIKDLIIFLKKMTITDKNIIELHHI